MDKDGAYSLEDLKRASAKNNRWQKCAGVMEEDGTPYGFKLFHLGPIHRPQRRGLKWSRNVLIIAVKDGKVKIISVYNEDIIPLKWNARNINVSNQKLLGLGLKS